MTRRRFLGTTGLAAAASGLTLRAQGGGSPAGAVAVEKNVPFGKGGSTELRLDIYRPPAGASKRMATIHVHGGGFTGGSKETLVERVPPYAARGYVALAVQYRLAGDAKWPAQIEDVKAAIRWTRANAGALSIEPDRIAVVGHSAGGQLALFAAGTPNRREFEGAGGTPGIPTDVAGCCAYYPGIELRRRADGSAHTLLPAGSDDAAHVAASPVTYITKAYPPTVIFHGTADTTIPVESSERLFRQLREADVAAELHIFEGLPHVFDSNREFAEAAAALGDLFLDRHVVNPRPWASSAGAARR